MLPKIATHLFQHTSRVAAAVQNQTSQAIRNALQQVTPTGSTAGGTGLTPYGGVGAGSGWSGGSNAGPGGAKFNAGSRYYSGYTVSYQFFSSVNYLIGQTRIVAGAWPFCNPGKYFLCAAR